MYRDGGASHIMVEFHLKLTLLNMQTMNFRVKYRRARSKFENLSRSAALTQFVKYISDETTQNHSINSPKHPKALENYANTHQKTFLTSKTACETHTYTILWISAMNSCCQV